MNKKLKKGIIIGASSLGAVLIAGGAVFFYGKQKEENTFVEVLPVSYVTTTYWEDSARSEGTVASDYIQELYPDGSRSIKEIFVHEGDAVQIGDPLLEYDKTKLELDLEARELDIQRVELELQEAEERLNYLKNTSPYVPPAPPPVPTPTPRPASKAKLHETLDLKAKPYKGTGTEKDPYIFLCTQDCTMTKEFLLEALGMNVPSPTPTPTPEPTSEPTSTPTPEPSEEPGDPEGSTPPAGANGYRSAPATSGPHGSEVPPTAVEKTEQEDPQDTDDEKIVIHGPFSAIFEVRDDNTEYGYFVKGWRIDGKKGISGFFELLETGEGEIDLDASVDYGTTSLGSGDPEFSNWDEINKAIEAQKQKIAGLNTQQKQAELDRDRAKQALENATVLSLVDGTVKTLTDLETAEMSGMPFLVVSGGQGLYVTGYINESLLGKIAAGSPLQANSWETGATYTGQVLKVSEYPSEPTGYYGYGAPNTSMYEFVAVLDNASDLRNGMYLDITFQQETQPDTALYLQQAYMRSDDGGKYVYKDVDGRLQKTYIATGKTVYGEYTEIKGGLTAEDKIAFPYGPDVKDGTRTKEPEGGYYW